MLIVKNNNIEIHYRTAGDAAKPTLILIFGMGMSCDEWFEFGYLDKLAAYFHLVAIDPRGHGLSTKPHGSSSFLLDDLASDIEAVIDHLQLSNVILWGYSLGAKIALAVADRRPKMVSGLVLGGFELHSFVDLSKDLVLDTLADGVHAWVELWKQMFDMPPSTAERMLQCDALALRELRIAESCWPTLAHVPGKLDVPVILYAGELCFFRDATKQMESLFQNSLYCEQPGRNHFELMMESDWISRNVIASFSTL